VLCPKASLRKRSGNYRWMQYRSRRVGVLPYRSPWSRISPTGLAPSVPLPIRTITEPLKVVERSEVSNAIHAVRINLTGRMSTPAW